MSKRVLNLLEPVKFIVWQVVIERVTVIKFRMENGGGNNAGCFEVEIWADTAKFTNVVVAGFRKCKDLVGEGKVFIKDETKVENRVGCSERRVVYLECCCLSPTRRNSVLEELRVRRFAVIQEEICCKALCK